MEFYNQNLIPPQCAAQSIGAANQLFIQLLQTLVQAQCSISPPEMWPADYGPTALQNGVDEYDFIVIGAGSAGATVASRLSEVPEWKILLIEAGGDPPIESEIPAIPFRLQKTRVDWQFYANSTTACQSSIGGCYWPRGKCLGGSSTINVMVYVRGNKYDFAEWVKDGADGWDYESNLPYFKKSEGNQQPSFVAYENGRYHNASGPLLVDYYGELSDVQKVFLQAGVERGHPVIDDINSDQLFGFLNAQGTVANGRRQSTAKAFLNPAKNRSNLHVIKNGFVEKILIDKRKRAYGVEFKIDGQQKMTAIARKEVILSAGAVMSPVLLQLSGIGPRKQLRKQNIPVIADLPVGKHLFDHIYAMGWFKYNANPTSPLDQLDYLYEFLIHNSGTFANPSLLMSFMSTVNGTERPEYQQFYLFYPPNSPDLVVFIDSINNTPEVKQTLIETNKKFGIVWVALILLHPKSHGVIKLNGTNPYNHPKIYPNYFANSDDMDILVHAMKDQVSFVETNAYKSLDVEFVKLPIEECTQYSFGSDSYWRCYIKHMSATLYHPVGTSKMGSRRDCTTVVDSRLKVHGIYGLRQIDAGVFPSLVSGNTNAATIMVAARGADFIKEEYLKLS